MKVAFFRSDAIFTKMMQTSKTFPCFFWTRCAKTRYCSYLDFVHTVHDLQVSY